MIKSKSNPLWFELNSHLIMKRRERNWKIEDLEEKIIEIPLGYGDDSDEEEYWLKREKEREWLESEFK